MEAGLQARTFKKSRIHDIYYVSLLMQDTTKKKQVKETMSRRDLIKT